MALSLELGTKVQSFLCGETTGDELRQWLDHNLRDLHSEGDEITLHLAETIWAGHARTKMGEFSPEDFRRRVERAFNEAIAHREAAPHSV